MGGQICTIWVIFIKMNILLHIVSLVYTLRRLARPRYRAPVAFHGHKAHVLIALIMAWLGPRSPSLPPLDAGQMYMLCPSGA